MSHLFTSPFFNNTEQLAQFVIGQSCRFNDNDNTFLTWTLESAGNRKTWTWSGWVKKSGTGELTLFSADGGDSTNMVWLYFNASDELALHCELSSVTKVSYRSNRKFRDYGAWGHLVVTLDTTVPSVTMWWNGIPITSWATSTGPTLNDQYSVNNTDIHAVGRRNFDAAKHFDGYMTEVHFCDGTAYTAGDFGEADGSGNWVPKEPSVSYGLNGFYLDFADAANLGKDAIPFVPAAEKTVSQSCRFNDDDSAHLYRTWGTASNRQKATYSFWIKRGSLTKGASQPIFGCNGNDWHDLEIDEPSTYADELRYTIYGVDNSYHYRSVPVKLRDSSAWYHVVLRIDTTQAAAADRIKTYVNGQRITATTNLGGTLNQNQDLKSFGDGASTHYIGRDANGWYLDAYLADFVCLAGQSLGPESFGGWDADGNWVPIDFSSSLSFGSQDVWLTFGNSGALGTDSSGNGNTYTASGLTAADQVKDSPTDDMDNAVGNYCTMNPLTKHASNCILSDGNLKLAGTLVGDNYGATGTIALPKSGKWAFQVTLNEAPGSTKTFYLGISQDPNTQGGASGNGTVNAYIGGGASWNKFKNDSNLGSVITPASGSAMEVLVDMNSQQAVFKDDGTTIATITSITAGTYQVWLSSENSNMTADFGQSGYTPSDNSYKALCTANLPAPAITDPSSYFQTRLYTGTGVAPTGVPLLGKSDLQPDLVWIKNRDSGTSNHRLLDSVRGWTKALRSNGSDAEDTNANLVTSSDPSVITLGTDSDVNASGNHFAAWCWKKGATPGFDIVAYTGNGANRTISHSAGGSRHFLVVKNRDNAGDGWMCHHPGLTSANYKIRLDSTGAESNTPTAWNGTAPTSAVFSLGTDPETNRSGNNFIAYLWAEVPGFSKFGSYKGVGLTDGTFVWCGFRPAFILLKNASNTGENWLIWDAKRDGHNGNNDYLIVNTTGAESTWNGIDILSNGFKQRQNDRALGGGGGAGSDTIIYAAFAEHPFGGSGTSQARAR